MLLKPPYFFRQKSEKKIIPKIAELAHIRRILPSSEGEDNGSGTEVLPGIKKDLK